jgi:two-component system, NtrC family, sensor histidine kinase PilS
MKTQESVSAARIAAKRTSCRLVINSITAAMPNALDSLLDQPPRVGTSVRNELKLVSFRRLWRAFMTARVLIAVMLLLLQGFLHFLGNTSDRISVAVCIGYLCATIAVRLFSKPRPPSNVFGLQWLLTIGVDVIAFTALNSLQSSAIYYTPLFALPVLLASVLGPILLALGTAATVTIFLLTDAWWLSTQISGESAGRFLQAGLSGSGFFAVALLANQLAIRLAKEEQTAAASQAVARTQTAVNELVVEALTHGVLVIDADGIVHSANPAACRLLSTREIGKVPPFVLATEAAWQPLVEVMRKTVAGNQSQESDVTLLHAGRSVRRLRVRTRIASADGNSGGALCVMFLEDLRELEARIRAEKVAAMGRMSAAVAHEIRNPLAAISQANALLDEDLSDPGQKRLTDMVQQNVQRLAKIVDDVLNISPAQASEPEQFGLALWLDDTVSRIAADWTGQTGSANLVYRSFHAGTSQVVFDPEHLRRVLVNLLDNARRYVTSSHHAIQIETQHWPGSPARVTVWSNGGPIEESVESHLFEPFFSSESRSSGLGLYICRELCERYGATIGYQRTARRLMQGNEFFVIFKSADLSADTDAYHSNDLFT